MEKAKHTPGPWEFEPQTGLVSASIAKPVAYVAGNVDLERANANGRMLATAPEMLEALEGLLRYLRVFWPDEPLFFEDEENQALEIFRAEAAIRKAKGE